MSLVAPCAVSSAPKNTGIDCAVKMSAPVLIILMPASLSWQAADEVDFLSWLETQIHATSKRVYPLFGNVANIRTITDGKESDVTVTYDDGSMAFIRNGTITRTFVTNKGGAAYAKALNSFNAFGNWAFIEVDKFMRVNRKANVDGSYSGFPLNVAYAPTPEGATLKTEYLIPFTLNIQPDAYVQNSIIATSDQYLLDVAGLVDAKITKAAAATTTAIKIGVQTIGTQTDLVAAFPTIADLTAFKIVDKVAGTVVTASAASIVAGAVNLAGTYTSGKTYTVSGTGATALKALSILGYEIVQGIDIAIP